MWEEPGAGAGCRRPGPGAEGRGPRAGGRGPGVRAGFGRGLLPSPRGLPPASTEGRGHVPRRDSDGAARAARARLIAVARGDAGGGGGGRGGWRGRWQPRGVSGRGRERGGKSADDHQVFDYC